MNTTIITLKVTKGAQQNKEFVFRHSTVCVMGRARDCFPQVPVHPDHGDISRHHCLLTIDLPHIHIKDLGSRNGTYVNEVPLEPHKLVRDLKEGDEIRLGTSMVFVVERVGAEEPHPKETGLRSAFLPPSPCACLNVKEAGSTLEIGFLGHSVRLGEGHLHLLDDYLAHRSQDSSWTDVVLDFT